MKLRHILCATVLLGLIVSSIWIVLAQEDQEAAEKAAISTVATELVNAALARDVDAIKANTDLPIVVIEGIGGRAQIVKEEDLEGLVQMVQAPAGVTLAIGKADVSLMGKTASAQIQLTMPNGPDLGTAGRCAFLLVKKDDAWRVKAASYYGY